MKGVKPRQHPSLELKALLALQADQVSFAQARSFGLSEKALRRLVAEGSWERTALGVYTSRPGPSDLRKRAWAAHLGAGGFSAIGGEASLQLSGLALAGDELVVWVPPDSQRRAGVRVRRDHLGRLAHARGLLPLIRPVDAVLDVGQFLPVDDLVALVAEAVRRGRTTPAQLARALDERPRVHDRRRLAAIIGDMTGIESTLEYAYRRDVERAHGLPRARRAVSVSAHTRSDALYEEYAVLVELDGRVGHADGAFRDLRRDNRHAASGFITLRYGSSDVRGRACEVARQVARVLSGRGWCGALARCPRCRNVPDSELSS